MVISSNKITTESIILGVMYGNNLANISGDDNTKITTALIEFSKALTAQRKKNVLFILG